MTDINCKNFIDNFEIIKKNIEEAKFISIDCEFSGLTENTLFKTSLFDSADERYEKLIEAIHGFIIIQIGITTFKYIPQENIYETYVYNFQLCPKCYGSVDNSFNCQSSALKFLCVHKFDFNEFMYNGISYVNDTEENILRKEIETDEWFNNVERQFLNEDEDIIQNVLSQLSKWLQTCVVGDTLNIGLAWHDDKHVMNYVLQQEIINRFKNKGISLFFCSEEIQIERHSINDKIKSESRKNIEQDLLNVTKSFAIKSILGFTLIFKLLIQQKKPIIGHNLLTDLLFMYKQFYQPLPKKLKTFKKDINDMFPIIFDTKYISYELNQILDKNQKWDSNSLTGLHDWLQKRTNFQHLLLYVPKIKVMDNISLENVKLHTGGWDSYITGDCFVKMIYLSCTLNNDLKIIIKPFTLTEQLSCVDKYKNKINLIRANINYTNLEGPDPISTRPCCILVQTKNKRKINLDEVAEIFADFGSVDVRHEMFYSALVAVGNHTCARLALSKLKNHPKYDVAPYKDYTGLHLYNTIFTISFVTSILGGAAFIYMYVVRNK